MEAEDTKQDKRDLPIGSGKFAKPVTMGKELQETYTHFQLREATMDDMFEAELELSSTGRGTHTPLVFNAEMMVRQLVRVFNDQGKEFKGPFTMNMLKNWGTRNYRAIRNAQVEIDVLGEGE